MFQASRADVLAKYRLGANRLQAAVELGRLAHRVRVRLGVEVRFLYGWTLTAGLEDADAQTRDEASALLQVWLTGVEYQMLFSLTPQGKWPKKKYLEGKIQGIFKCCQNTGNFVCFSFKFPDYKIKDILKSVLHMKWSEIGTQKIPIRKGKHREFAIFI